MTRRIRSLVTSCPWLGAPGPTGAGARPARGLTADSSFAIPSRQEGLHPPCHASNFRILRPLDLMQPHTFRSIDPRTVRRSSRYLGKTVPGIDSPADNQQIAVA